VDILWLDDIQPMLLQRYPGATPEQLRRAHACAYGGSLVQDIGYYPFANRLFSDLTHCVRSGEFVANLIREAEDMDEYAFALGALSHYAGDIAGHPVVNRAVAIYFPRLRARYGEIVTCADCHRAHLQAEFGFDITQLAKRRYASQAYHDYIGFEVCTAQLERAFRRTYGVPLQEVVPHVDLAVRTFRQAVSRDIPWMARAALTGRHPERVPEAADDSEALFLYNLSRTDYARYWGKESHRAGLLAHVVGWVIRCLPKVGALDAMGYKVPTPETEALFIQSVNEAVAQYRLLLQQVSRGELEFAEMDCDTGLPTAQGEYATSDQAYARLFAGLVKRGLQEIPPDLRADILDFYAGGEVGLRAQGEGQTWAPKPAEMEALRATAGSGVVRRLPGPRPRLCSPKT